VPCIARPDANSTVLNPNSWNRASNMLYINQPAETGFSYDVGGTTAVNTTATAAKVVVEALEIWMTR